MEDDDGFIEAIAPDVLKALQRVRFFQALDDQMCPTDPAQPRASCQGSYTISTGILTDCGFDSAEAGEIIQVLKARGAQPSQVGILEIQGGRAPASIPKAS